MARVRRNDGGGSSDLCSSIRRRCPDLRVFLDTISQDSGRHVNEGVSAPRCTTRCLRQESGIGGFSNGLRSCISAIAGYAKFQPSPGCRSRRSYHRDFWHLKGSFSLRRRMVACQSCCSGRYRDLKSSIQVFNRRSSGQRRGQQPLAANEMRHGWAWDGPTIRF